jgi:hypothetical protein
MDPDLPFSKQTRPWATQECIDNMNQQWVICMSKIPEADREGLKYWAANKVEMGYCIDHPEHVTRTHHWGGLRAGWLDAEDPDFAPEVPEPSRRRGSG